MTEDVGARDLVGALVGYVGYVGREAGDLLGDARRLTSSVETRDMTGDTTGDTTRDTTGDVTGDVTVGAEPLLNVNIENALQP